VAKKLLYALQFHKGDQQMAMNLARLIADVIPERKCTDFDMMFAASANASFDMATIRYCARKFGQVRTFRCVKDINGWPAGPNNQAHETARYFAQQCMSGRWNYAGILLGEPDCVPLKREFFALIAAEWRQGPQTVMGPWIVHGPPPYNQHINGNSVFGPQFVYNNPVIFRADDWIGWDAANAGLLMQHGRASKWMFSDYRLGKKDNPWKGCDHLFAPRPFMKPHPFWKLGNQDVAYMHGVKAWQEAQECVRHRLLGEELKVLPKQKETAPPPKKGRKVFADERKLETKATGIAGSTD
jgi:hypothetical protein